MSMPEFAGRRDEPLPAQQQQQASYEHLIYQDLFARPQDKLAQQHFYQPIYNYSSSTTTTTPESGSSPSGHLISTNHLIYSAPVPQPSDNYNNKSHHYYQPVCQFSRNKPQADDYRLAGDEMLPTGAGKSPESSFFYQPPSAMLHSCSALQHKCLLALYLVVLVVFCLLFSLVKVIQPTSTTQTTTTHRSHPHQAISSQTQGARVSPPLIDISTSSNQLFQEQFFQPASSYQPPANRLAFEPASISASAGSVQEHNDDYRLQSANYRAPEQATSPLSAASDDESPVVWSAWSQWSSCVDKNGLCDPQRLHSRLRKCLAQRTGEKVEALECRQRFNMQDQELEVSDCAQHCAQSAQIVAPEWNPLLSDAPQVGSVAMLPESSEADLLETVSMEPGAVSSLDQGSTFSPASNQVIEATGSSNNNFGDPSHGTARNLSPQLQMSCSNCTLDEICLLLVQQKVPFCAKIKDRLDESGCGGWCKPASGQLCQPVGLGSNAFKCVHDSECLPDEWRCHDSACIPLAKRCDGHFNCYDNSDERDCLG